MVLCEDYNRVFFLGTLLLSLVYVESYKGLSLASPVDHPSTIQLPTAQGVTYPTHALVYYCSAANRKAFSNTR